MHARSHSTALWLILPVLAGAAGSTHAAGREEPRVLGLFAANDTPTAGVEAEFWRSAERIGTPEAYRAYLAAFPSGVFAPLARAALAKESSLATPGANAAGATRAEVAKPSDNKASPTLRYFSEAAPYTGSIAFNVGDRFTGPGPLTVGWIGAKKQVVLPPGEWVVLAATDGKSYQAQMAVTIPGVNRVDLTTLVLGKFAGDRLSALLRFTSNIRPATTPTWTDLAECDLSDATRLHHARTQPTTFRNECVAIRSLANPMTEAYPAADEVRRSLARIGARMSGAAVVLVLSFAERANGYLGITRMDWPALTLGAESEPAEAWYPQSLSSSPLRSAYVTALLAWAQAYRAVASDGYRRALGAADLTPGAGAIALGLAVSEFDPTTLRAGLPK